MVVAKPLVITSAKQVREMMPLPQTDASKLARAIERANHAVAAAAKIKRSSTLLFFWGKRTPVALQLQSLLSDSGYATERWDGWFWTSLLIEWSK
jgi:hypothetical protein